MKLTLLLTIVLLLFASACSAPDTPAPVGSTPVPTLQNAASPAPTEIPAVSTRVDRRAPTLAPTEPATEIPTQAPTATTAPTATETALPVASPTTARVQTLAPAATATPNLAPAVYVTSFELDPPAPKSKPAEFLFHVSFLNTVGENVNYPRWRVLIVPKGQTKAVGDPQGASKTIATGTSRQNTEPWSIKVTSVCEAYTASPVWEDENGKQTPFPSLTGDPVTVDFLVCP